MPIGSRGRPQRRVLLAGRGDEGDRELRPREGRAEGCTRWLHRVETDGDGPASTNRDGQPPRTVDDTPSGCHPERADRRRRSRSSFAPAHLLENTLEALGTIHRHRESMGATPEDRGAGRGGLSTPVHGRSRSVAAGGERATRGAIGACSVGQRGERRRTRSFDDDGRCDTRDGRGCTQRPVPGEGPRILHRAMNGGERRRSAKRTNTPLSTLPGARSSR